MLISAGITMVGFTTPGVYLFIETSTFNGTTSVSQSKTTIMTL
jgi:hypothetical protein